MQFIIKNNSQPINETLRHLGYRFLKKDTAQNQLSFSRRVYGTAFPRFHIYLQEKEDRVIINLHLDQKAPSYKDQTAHSADYKGDILKQEAQRLKDLWHR